MSSLSVVESGVSPVISVPVPDEKHEPSAAPTQLSRLSQIRLRLKLFSVLIFSGAQILDTLNVTGLILETYQIATKYNIGLETAVWAISAYSLTFGTFIVLGGRIADYVGHRLTFMIGMAILAICSGLAGGIANEYALFVLRAIQGLGGALVAPTSFGLVAHTFKGEARMKAYAAVGASAAMGGVIGVIVGGAFAMSSIGYRGLLFLSCGMAAFFGVTVYFAVEETPRQSDRSLTHLDWVGSLLLVCAGIAVLYGFISGPGNWSKAKFIAPLIVGIFMFIIVILYHVYWYRKLGDSEKGFEPLLPKRIWRYTNYVQLFIYMGFLSAAFYSFMLTVAQEMQILRGSSPIMTGVQMLTIAVVFVIGCVCSASIFKYFNLRTLLYPGPVLVIVGLALASRIDKTNTYWSYIFVSSILVSFGIGSAMPNGLNAVSMSARLSDQGVVSGGVQLITQLLVSISFSIASSEIDTGSERHQYQISYYTLIAFAAVSLVTSFFIKPVQFSDSLQESTNHELNAEKVEAVESINDASSAATAEQMV